MLFLVAACGAHDSADQEGQSAASGSGRASTPQKTKNTQGAPAAPDLEENRPRPNCSAEVAVHWQDLPSEGEIPAEATLPTLSWKRGAVQPSVESFSEQMWDGPHPSVAPPAMTRTALEARGATQRSGEVSDDMLELRDKSLETGSLLYWGWRDGIPTRARFFQPSVKSFYFIDIRYQGRCRTP